MHAYLLFVSLCEDECFAYDVCVFGFDVGNHVLSSFVTCQTCNIM